MRCAGQARLAARVFARDFECALLVHVARAQRLEPAALAVRERPVVYQRGIAQVLARNGAHVDVARAALGPVVQRVHVVHYVVHFAQAFLYRLQLRYVVVGYGAALGYALAERRAVVGDLVDELERRVKPVVRGGQCGQILRRAVRLTRDIAQAQ